MESGQTESHDNVDKPKVGEMILDRLDSGRGGER